MNTRNGDRRRDFDTRAGTIDVAIPPKLRNASYVPTGFSSVAAGPSGH